jgi:replicative superfamily II helicase
MLAVPTAKLYTDVKHCTLYASHCFRYLALLARATPIESSFIKALPDHLNAEVVAGTVTSVKEAVAWLGYTYLHVRMQKNPMAYGMRFSQNCSHVSIDSA